MTAPRARRRRALPGDGLIDLIAVDIAAHGARPVALTRAKRQLAAARIIARGGTPYVISKRLHVSGITALMPAARCQGAMTRVAGLADGGNRVVAIGPVPQGQTVEATRDEAGERSWTLLGQAREILDRDFRGARPSGVPTRPAPTGKADGGPR